MFAEALMVFSGIIEGIVEGNQEGRMLLEFCDTKHLCIANTWSRKADRQHVTFGSGCNESKIDFCIMGTVDGIFFCVVSKLLQGICSMIYC